MLELMLVLSLMGLFFGAVYETVLTGLRTMSAADDREEIRQRLTSALERLTREANVASDVDVAQSDAATNRFQFDTSTATNVNYVYTTSTGMLTRADASSPQQIILRNLTAFDFDYTDCAGTLYAGTVPNGDPEDTLRIVQISATVTQSGETISLASAAYLRNMAGFAGVPAQTCGTL